MCIQELQSARLEASMIVFEPKSRFLILPFATAD